MQEFNAVYFTRDYDSVNKKQWCVKMAQLLFNDQQLAGGCREREV